MGSPLYQQERALRNKVLLRPFGLPDHAWEMQDKNSYHLIAIDSEKVIACLLLCPKENHSIQLMQMAVEPELQKNGIGKKLVEAAVLKAKTAGLKTLFCHSRENAIGFYLSQGFEVYDEPFVEVGLKHIKMKKRL
ncbi:MAG: GNAT family N-acetyltransferase [Halobacteriovoraceae bacterium]|jgi:N-acetylglutamate synthase-like GNAT family acetyltransferase|nr:GNAT family N-acetyltransferase [Halobacteriovoraceae bacterium]